MATPLRGLLIEDVVEEGDLLLRELRQGGYDPAWERVETAEAMQKALAEQAWDIIASVSRLRQGESRWGFFTARPCRGERE